MLHTKQVPYKTIAKGRKPNISHFHAFGCKCFILNIKENLGKFDDKTNEGIFVGYSTHSKAYKIYNKRTCTIEETMHVTFDEVNNISKYIDRTCDDIIPTT